MQTGESLSTTTPAEGGVDDRFAANDVRLSLGDWLIAGTLTLGAFWLIPLAWQQIEPLGAESDYRVPYSLGNDYWHYERTCNEICRASSAVLIGDSVLWGHYVESKDTLSHYLNELLGEERLANLAVDGIHPVALAGLIENHAKAIRSQRVIVNCNLLWLSSPRHDLSSVEEAPLNHPALVPQFAVRIPSYRAPLAERLGIVAARHFGFLGWADHLRIAYFGSDDLATWTLEHPYANPLAEVTGRLPSADEPPSPAPDARPWNEKGIRPISPDWVPLDESLQWRFFRHTIELLKTRGNRVFVIIGPLNEHMLTAEGLEGYSQRKRAVATWHDDQAVLYAVPEALPSEMYADLSHPTAAGYALLAERLMTEEAFRNFVGE